MPCRIIDSELPTQAVHIPDVAKKAIEFSELSPDIQNINELIEKAAQGGPQVVEVKAADGSTQRIALDSLLQLLMTQELNKLGQAGIDQNNATQALLTKIGHIDELTNKILDATKQDGSCDVKSVNVTALAEALAKEGISLPISLAQKKQLSNAERDTLLRSLSHQREDLSTQANQSAHKAQKLLEQQHVVRQYIFAMLTSLRDAFRRIIANVATLSR